MPAKAQFTPDAQASFTPEGEKPKKRSNKKFRSSLRGKSTDELKRLLKAVNRKRGTKADVSLTGPSAPTETQEPSNGLSRQQKRALILERRIGVSGSPKLKETAQENPLAKVEALKALQSGKYKSLEELRAAKKGIPQGPATQTGPRPTAPKSSMDRKGSLGDMESFQGKKGRKRGRGKRYDANASYR